jgi:hypothetical protein
LKDIISRTNSLRVLILILNFVFQTVQTRGNAFTRCQRYQKKKVRFVIVANCVVKDIIDNPNESKSDSFYFVNDEELIMHNKVSRVKLGVTLTGNLRVRVRQLNTSFLAVNYPVAFFVTVRSTKHA